MPHACRRSRGGEDATPASSVPSAAAADAGDMPLAVDVAEDAFAFAFTADVPGVQRSAVKVRSHHPTPFAPEIPSATALGRLFSRVAHTIMLVCRPALHQDCSGVQLCCCLRHECGRSVSSEMSHTAASPCDGSSSRSLNTLLN